MEDIVTGLLLLSYGVLVALDFLAPARQLPKVKRWRLKGSAFFVLNFGLFSVLPFVWDAWLGEHRLLDASRLGTVGGAVVGLLALQLFSYVWHRSMHNVPFLWRWFHQMHHSAERIDIFGAMYFSPLDVLGFAFMGSLALVLVVGVSPQAALLANLAATFASLFQHANLRTPRWLGYIIQRPENHAQHHARGVHAYNYGDIAFWDIVFGTFRNPATWDGEAGFYDGASTRIGEMLRGKDVSTPPATERALGGDATPSYAQLSTH